MASTASGQGPSGFSLALILTAWGGEVGRRREPLGQRPLVIERQGRTAGHQRREPPEVASGEAPPDQLVTLLRSEQVAHRFAPPKVVASGEGSLSLGRAMVAAAPGGVGAGYGPGSRRLGGRVWRGPCGTRSIGTGPGSRRPALRSP